MEDWHSSERDRAFEDEEVEALLNEDSCQSQTELAQSLGVTQQAVLKCLSNLEMIQKAGNWLPSKLKPRDIE